MAKPQAERSISQKYVVRPWFVLFLSGMETALYLRFFVLPDILKNAEDRKTERLEHSVKGCNISIV